jgi:hypothetical protein
MALEGGCNVNLMQRYLVWYSQLPFAHDLYQRR